MGYLLTVGVLGFQIAIFVTIVGAATMGRGTLRLVTAGWVAFTLFGSIFTAGLLLLQLLTIAVSYNVGKSGLRHASTVQPKQPIAPPPPAAKTESIGAFWVLAIIGGALWLAYIFDSSHHQPSAETNAVPTERDISTVSELNAVASKPKPSSSAAPKRRPSQKRPAQADLRHCLALESNDAIARCAEQVH